MAEVIDRKNKITRILSHLFLMAGTITMVLPFFYMVGSSFKPPPEIIAWPPTFLPKNWTLDNYLTLAEKAPFVRFFFNSLFVSAVSTLFILFTSTLSGFVFSKYKFPGKNFLFIIILATAMVPFETYLIPLYIIVKDLRMINTYQGIILPYAVMSFGIFLMRQNISSVIPDELLDAGRIDGCSEWMLFRIVVIPLSASAIGALGILAFMQAWMAFIWPLILATSREMYTMEVGLAMFQQRFTIEYGGVLAGSTISIIPIIVVFLILRRSIIEGMTLTGLKG